MVTPVPVVSMMYFLVSTPPKTFFIVRPAFSAMSTKLAADLGDEIAAACCAAHIRNSAVVTAKRKRMRCIPGVKRFLPKTKNIRLWMLGAKQTQRQANGGSLFPKGRRHGEAKTNGFSTAATAS